MKTDKISLVKTELPQEQVAFKGNESSVQISSGSTKDIVATLSTLAAIGIAGIAIYKHKSAKEAVDKAVKRAEEAELKAKQIAEEVDKKVKEAVDKAKKDFETEKNSKKTGFKDKISNSFNNVKAKFSSTPKAEKKAENNKKVGLKERMSNLYWDITAKLSNYPKEGSVVRNDKNKGLKNKISNFFSGLKARFKRAPKAGREVEAVEIPKVEEAPKVEEINEVIEEEANETKAGLKERLGNFFSGLKARFKRTPKAEKEVEAVEIPKVEEAPKVEEINEVIEEEANETKAGLKERLGNFFSGLKARFKRTPKAEKEVEAVEIPKVEETPKVEKITEVIEEGASESKKSIKLPDVRTVSEENLVAEYNALSKIVKDLPVEDAASLRFLEIQGELFNHRGYRFENGRLSKVVKASPKATETPLEKEQQELQEQAKELKQEIKAKLSGKTDYAAQSDSLIKEPMSQAEHDDLQAFYDTFANHGTELTEAYKGIKLPDVRTVSEENLVAEYNALSKIVKGLPVEDATSLRFMEVQGELFNHRGYRFQDGRLSKVVKTAPKAVEKPVENEQHELQEQGKNLKQSLEEQLDGRDKLVPETPRKHNTRYHNKPQKEYDKALGVKEVLPLEYQGLSEVERLYIERDALMAQKYGKDRAEARLLEVLKRLEELGVKENPIKKETPEIVVRTAIVRDKAERDYWQSLVESNLKEQEEIIKDMKAKGIKPLELDEKEAGLQYEYAKNIKSAQYQYEKNDMEWFQRYTKNANKILQQLKDMGKEPLNFETEEMELQYILMALKDHNSNYRGYVAELDTKAEELTKKLEEMIKN